MNKEEAQSSTGDMSEELKLLDVVAHDLRTGLVPIKTHAQMLAAGIMGPVSAKQAEALHAIDLAVDKQVDRIAATLDVVRARQNRLEVECKPIILEELLKQAVAMVERDCKRRGVTVRTKFDPRGGVIEGDYNRLRRIFAALLSRQVEQSPQNGALGVEIKTLRVVARVRLWDQGSGSSAGKIAALFKNHVEQAQGKKEQPDIMLAAAPGILNAHKARVRVQTGMGQGSTFLIYFPLLKPVAAPEPRPDKLAALFVNLPGPLLEILRQLAAKEGCEAISVPDGKQALMAAREQHCALIFSAALLPDLDARQLQEAIQAQRPEDSQAFCLIQSVAEGQSGVAPAPPATWLLAPEAGAVQAGQAVAAMLRSLQGAKE